MEFPVIWTIRIIVCVFYAQSVSNQEYNVSLREAQVKKTNKTDQGYLIINKFANNFQNIC